ncbi:carbamoyltransferase HypF [Halomonas sp. ZH2S]|uniref:Carbamoyltransferase HypF n=1 Tax=Vreelandella zhuhanensis TaxID=2684210 RepID=A0A7X3KQQ9_9GAMM|nr:carbamoyltransferase HypF [Halomonas zhuhanensis]MWJ28168.1 carbamoyltransferase HypF [Halomonas zhuhanensis]
MPRVEEQGACRWLITGRVQGVGFRPFIYRLARELGLNGFVRNRSGTVEVVTEGDASSIEAFAVAVQQQAPSLARPTITSREKIPAGFHADFRILASSVSDADIHIPADYSVCARCYEEMQDLSNRRYRYPFINCTECGPRYSLIKAMPYDRAQTTMSEFTLCGACRAEYENPNDRRFHAEPLACVACGPALWYSEPGRAAIHGNENALADAVAQLRDGLIVAVKGVGGYHLMIDARNERAVARLRIRKHRPHKPFAVLFPVMDNLIALHKAVITDDLALSALSAPDRPIVILPKRRQSRLADCIAPGLSQLGAMLPYSPLHQLLLQDVGGALVTTSANISGEPVVTEPEEAETLLANVADGFLHHNRPILCPIDDSVVEPCATKTRAIRIGRGLAPLELQLPRPISSPTLATGAHLKNTLALAWDNRVVISPHIGDLDSRRSQAVFARTASELQRLYDVRAETVICDTHDGYASTRWAKGCGLSLQRVGHHQAHASALVGEWPEDTGSWLVFTWDGVGLGSDGTLWGGEALLGKPGQWRRAGSFRPFRLAGGDRVGREPWRSAAALCWTAGFDWNTSSMAKEAWQKGLNCHETSSAGRLFDAAAAMIGLTEMASFEGQAPMWLEAIADPDIPALPLPLHRDAERIWRTDWAPLIPFLMDGRQSPAARAGLFQASMALALVQQALRIRAEHGEINIGLAGGVFQNRLLVEQTLGLLDEQGFTVRLNEQVPCNDASISFGQIIEALYGDF